MLTGTNLSSAKVNNYYLRMAEFMYIGLIAPCISVADLLLLFESKTKLDNPVNMVTLLLLRNHI